MKPRKTKAEKIAEARVDKLVGNALCNNPINMMDITKVYGIARGLVGAGSDDASTAEKLAIYVASIKVAA
jgi:hypothetical protein